MRIDRYRAKNGRNVVSLIAAVSAVLLMLMALSSCGKSAEKPLTVDVFAQQYVWSFGYPGKNNAFSDDEMHLPSGRQINFKMYSQDVVHAFWVPEWELKRDIVPGVTAAATFTPEKVGTYQLICAHSCGIDHGTMRAKVVVEPPTQFHRWVSSLKRSVPSPLLESIRRNVELQRIRRETKANQ